MKILLDHHIPHQMRHPFSDYCEMYTASYLGRQDLTNGELMKAVRDAAFSVFINNDRNLGFQQNLTRYPIGIIFLRVHPVKLSTLSELVPSVVEVLPTAAEGRHLAIFR